MATLTKAVLFAARQSRRCDLLSNKLSTSAAAAAGHWNKDWKPGPLPKTPEERAAAAKKYGLRPEDYVTEDDGSMGDYPKLPIVARSQKDQFENYDWGSDYRNYKTPIYQHDDIVGIDLHDPNQMVVGNIPLWTAAYRALRFMFGIFFLWWLTYDFKYHLPEMPKSYPFNDLYLEKGGDPAKEPTIKHYTFNPPALD